MKQLEYLDSFMRWIRPYYFKMTDWDKGLTTAVFCLPKNENLECVIFLTYDIGIDNPNVKPGI